MTAPVPDPDPSDGPENGPGDTCQPGTLRYAARIALTRTIEAFVDAVRDAEHDVQRNRRRTEDFPEWTPLRDALDRWRALGRDGE